jgi:hypothetical protein
VLLLIFILRMSAEYETARPVEVEIDGVKHAGTYRVMAGSVIVYCGDEVKFAAYGTTPSERVARWLLRDICLRHGATKRENAIVSSCNYQAQPEATLLTGDTLGARRATANGIVPLAA